MDLFQDFFSSIKDFLSSHNIEWTTTDYVSDGLIMETAKTKEKRDKDLQKFFKSALAHVRATNFYNF